MDVSSELGSRLSILLKHRITTLAGAHDSYSSSICSTSSLASFETAGTGLSLSRPSPLPRGVDTTSTASATQGSNAHSSASSSLTEYHVLLCVFRGTILHPDQITVSEKTPDVDFFDEFRNTYWQLRGFWRGYLSPQQFYHCPFTRFRIIDVRTLVKHGTELPTCPTYMYTRKPTEEQPQIGKHEWYHRFYYQKNCLGSQGLALIPKRERRFRLDLHATDGMEDMWGLNAEYYIACHVVMIYFVASSICGVLFWILWGKYRPESLDIASVPLSITITTFAAWIVQLYKGSDARL